MHRRPKQAPREAPVPAALAMLADAEFAPREFGSTAEILAAPTAEPAVAPAAPFVIEPWPDEERRQAAAENELPVDRPPALAALKAGEGGFDPPPLDLGPPVVTPPLIRPEIPEPDWRTEELELQERERQERARRERHEKLLRLIDEEGT